MWATPSVRSLPTVSAEVLARVMLAVEKRGASIVVVENWANTSGFTHGSIIPGII